METKFDVMETTIPKGRTLQIQDGKNFEVRVVAGQLWITQERDTADYVLDPCETFRVSRNGRTLLHALKGAQLQIAYPTEAGMPSLTLAGGYREVAWSVARAMLAEWLRDIRDRIVGVTRPRTPQVGRAAKQADVA
jgi:Protein of unknown function (DUF2917)